MPALPVTSLSHTAAAASWGVDDIDALSSRTLTLGVDPSAPHVLLLAAASAGHAHVVEDLLTTRGADVNGVPTPPTTPTTAHTARALRGESQSESTLNEFNEWFVSPAAMALRGEGDGDDGDNAMHPHTSSTASSSSSSSSSSSPAKAAIMTPLAAASRHGHADTVRVLLQHGADCDRRAGATGATPLELAVRGDHVDVVEILVAAGADANGYTSQPGVNPVTLCSYLNHVKCLIVLLNGGGTVVCGRATDAVTTLQPWEAAVICGNVSAVSVLLSTGSLDVNTRLFGNGSALFAAAQLGYTDMAAMLVAAGANINELCPDLGATPLHAAAEGG
jgi:ankyrin repeat protein